MPLTIIETMRGVLSSPGARNKKVAYVRRQFDPFSRKWRPVFSKSRHSRQYFSMECTEKYAADKKL